MSTPGSRGAGAASGGRSAAATGPQATVARELLDLIEFSITALRRQASLVSSSLTSCLAATLNADRAKICSYTSAPSLRRYSLVQLHLS